MSDAKPRLLILGTRGVPAAHGGFETFAERLALDLVARGWAVTVYCQHERQGASRRRWVDRWRGIERVNIAVGRGGPVSTLVFDGLCALDAAVRGGTCLVLGYNGAAALPYLRLRGRTVVTNMDGIEWRRPKWGKVARAWLLLNERIAALASHRLVADHPEIARYLAARYPRASVTTIPYGADPVVTAAEEPVRQRDLEPGRYLLLVARIEPDNNVLSIVRAFSRRPRGVRLAVVGKVDPATDYGRAVRAAAGSEVRFPGAIYDVEALRCLRFHALAYVHGHMAGGTNPSLVEALWAGNAVIAHDNPYNRWTAGSAGLYFRDEAECEERIDVAARHTDRLAGLRREARHRAAADFDWAPIVAAYERLCRAPLPAGHDRVALAPRASGR